METMKMPKYTFPKEPTEEVVKDLLDNSVMQHSDAVDTSKDTWLLFPVKTEDKQCIEDFMTAFNRPPQHIVTEQIWKLVGPVTTKEETERKWRNRETKN